MCNDLTSHVGANGQIRYASRFGKLTVRLDRARPARASGSNDRRPSPVEPSTLLRLDSEQGRGAEGRVTRHTLSSICILALSVLLTACVLSRTTEGPVHTYLLKMEEGTWAAPSSGEKRAAHGTLLISPPQADPGFDTPRMVYLTRPYEVSYYTANQWADTPARMLASLLTYSMEKSGLWRTVVSLPTSIRGDYRLDTQGLILQQEFFQQPSHIRLALRVQLIEQREQKVIGSKRIEMLENAPSEDAYGGVVAANRAVTKLLDQVAVWVRGCLSSEQECNR